MELIKNLGVSYKGDYINQGSQIDKIKQASKLDINYVELTSRIDGKDLNLNNVNDIYKGTVIFHLPTINNTLTNLPSINDIVLELLKYDVKTVTIDASNLSLELYEWSTFEEQQNYIKNIASGLAAIAANNIQLAIENTKDYKGQEIFGKNIQNIQDLIIYTKEILIKKYNFLKAKADEIIGVSININNFENNLLELKNWFTIFKNDVKCIKIRNDFSNISELEYVIDLIIELNLDKPILLQTKSPIEETYNEYKKCKYLITLKLDNKPVNLINYNDVKSTDYKVEYNFNYNNQKGFTNILITVMILLTALISAMMFYIRFK